MGYYVHLNKANAARSLTRRFGISIAGEITAATLVAKEGDTGGPPFENRPDSGEEFG